MAAEDSAEFPCDVKVVSIRDSGSFITELREDASENRVHTCGVGYHLRGVALLTSCVAVNDADVTGGVMVTELAYHALRRIEKR